MAEAQVQIQIQTSTATETGTGTATDTATGTATDTATGTATDTDTDTATGTATDTDTGTATDTATGTATDTDTDTDTDTETGTGFVLKGPLHQATVFHDYNDNGVLDQGEPSTLTAEDGSYTLAKAQNAPEIYSVVVQMGANTIDYGSGESYAASSVGLKGSPADGGVVTPMTTIHEHSKGESDGAIAPADLSKALGLPASVDILTFNSHAAGVDKALAHEVETIAQHLMTMKLLVAETIVGSSVSGTKSMTDGLAEEIALDALVKLLVEVAANQASGSAGTVSIEGALDITNADHLEELEKLIEADLKGGTFGAELTVQDATVPFEVFEYTIEHSSDLINKVASEFDKLGADDFGSIRAHGVSHLKHEAAEQILALAKAVRSHFDANAEVTSFNMQGFLPLANAGEFNLALEDGYTLVRKHIIAINGYTDTDNDGLPDTCDAGCLATGLAADPDDDNDGVLDGADIFPFNKDESVDTDGDGTGNNADTDDDNDGVADSADDFPLNAKLSSSFRLNSVSIADYVDQDRTMATYTTAATMGEGVLSLALADGVVIDRSNLKNLVDSNSATGTAPKLVLTLDKVPTAGTTGTVMLDLMLMENDDLDQTYQTAERKLSASITVNWKSDGTNVEMTVPAGGSATLGYAHNGNSYALSRVNGAADVVTFNKSDNYSNTPASIEVRAIDFFAAAAAANAKSADLPGLNLGSFFDGANNYHIAVGIAQGTDLGNFFYQSSDVLITKIMANLKLGEVPGRFNLHRVGLLDYVDGMSNKAVVYGLSPTVSAAGKLSVAMGTGNVVDLSNLKSLVDSNGSTGMAPRLLLAMNSVPASGESGAMELTISLLEGADAVQSTSERMLTGSITANWSADASGDVAVTVPAQSLSMTYTKGSTTATVTGANGAADMITLSQSKAFENFPATLEVRILDWFTAATKTGAEFAGIDLAGFFEAGDYTVMVTIDQGTDEVLYYRRAENAALLTSLQASVTVGEAATTMDKYDVMVDDWSTASSSPVELHVIYPAGTPREEIRLHPAVNGKTMEFDFGPSMTIKKAHINGLLNGTADAGELVPALQFKMANVPTISGAFTLKMTVGGGGLTMTSMVDVSYNGSDFTVPSQTQDVTVTDSSVCQSGCTFTLESTAETLDISAPGIYPPTLTAKLISLFDLNLAGRNSEVTVELQAGNFDLVIEVLSDGTPSATTVDNILTYGGVPINKVEGVIIIE